MYYVDDIDAAKLMRTGIEAMVESLDPYTNYISESEIEDYRFMTTGQYGGVGSSIFTRNNYAVIKEVYEGFAAQKAGLIAGDIILEIDGKSIKGKNTGEVSKFLKGQAGTSIKILIQRPTEEKPRLVNLTREEIQIENVTYYGMITPEIGYIQLKGFTQDANKEVKNALLELKKNMQLKGVILDVRGNPGGLLHEAVAIANIFVPKGELIVNTKGKAKEGEKKYFTINDAIDVNIPLAVLTNSSSASASEIVSGVMQDLDRGIIVGQRTFGKGLVQTTRPLSYNAQLKITTAKYYIPSGRCIQALDYSHRNADGSVGKVPDSLIKAYQTKSGRKVFDGGGVAPDFAIPVNTYSNITNSLISKHLIFDFATQYASKHSTIKADGKFSLTEAEYQEFENFLKDKEFDYTTNSEKLLEEYKKEATKENHFDAVAEDFKKLKTKLSHDKMDDLKRHQKEISDLICQEIASRYFYQKGRTQQQLSSDTEVLKAMSILLDSDSYQKTLKN
jgi:carboxyl-terminal processing protease